MPFSEGLFGEDDDKEQKPRDSGEARQLTNKDREKMAKMFGVDTSKPGWETELDQRIRKASGT